MRRFIPLLSLIAAPAFAVPMQLPHAGRLLDADGGSISGARQVVFTLYGSEAGADVRFQEQLDLSLADGFYEVVLGAGATTLDAADLAGDEVWLGVRVLPDVELSPRQRLGSVPYAIRAGTTDNLPDPSACNEGDLLRFSAAAAGFVCAAPTSVGNVINVTTRVSNTPQTLSDFNTREFERFPVTKVSPTSYLLVMGTLSGRGNYSGDLQQGWRYGTAPEVMAQGVMYDENVHTKVFPTMARIDTSLTGTHDMVFRYFDNVGNGGERPFLYYNPNSSSGGGGSDRLSQTQSVYVVWEIEP